MLVQKFYHILGNTLLSTVTNMFVWFALTFWVFLETRSILATSLIAGVFALTNAISAFFFGSVVDHNQKKYVFAYSSAFSLLFYGVGTTLYFSLPQDTFSNPASPYLWIFILILMLGSVIGNLRSIALTTLVTLFFDENVRPKMNGLVGTANGIAFAATSILSGFAIGYVGMGISMILVLLSMGVTLVHLLLIDFTDRDVVPEVNANATEKMDMKGTIAVLQDTPGILPLIFFTAFNNFLGGVFMALMDSYALSIMDVRVWGFFLAFLSTGFIVGGFLVSKMGLGKSPIRTLFNMGMITWIVCIFFTSAGSIPIFIGGLFIWMLSVPIIEASESTILQKVIPMERQGRVIGVAQTLEHLASPITAFLIGPLTHFFFIPFMTTGWGAYHIGSWFGTGEVRAMALVFTVTGFIGLIVTVFAKYSKAASDLENRYQEEP